MLGFYIKYDTVSGEKGVVAVGVLAGFCDKKIGVTHMDIAADGVQNSADGDRRIVSSGQKYLTHHRGGGCFSVCSGDCNGTPVIGHDLS